MSDNSKHVPRISSYMYKNELGITYTKTYRDGKLMSDLPTDESQVREPRKSLLWTAGENCEDKTFMRITSKR